tara:strand:- start:96 stop:635 length:540 start_codon:yes stop_codon:yes gene_type:complete
MKLLSYSTLLKINIIIFIFLSHSFSTAQNDLQIKKNNKKATLLSLACPGLGQVYNKKLWKVPIIYTALGGSAFFVIKHNKNYQNYKNAYFNRLDDDINTTDNYSNYSNNNLLTLKNYHQNSRDLSTLIFVLIYILNVVDASVDSHLNHYNLNDNLSLYLNEGNIDPGFKSLNISISYNL